MRHSAWRGEVELLHLSSRAMKAHLNAAASIVRVACASGPTRVSLEGQDLEVLDELS